MHFKCFRMKFPSGIHCKNELADDAISIHLYHLGSGRFFTYVRGRMWPKSHQQAFFIGWKLDDGQRRVCAEGGRTTKRLVSDRGAPLRWCTDKRSVKIGPSVRRAVPGMPGKNLTWATAWHQTDATNSTCPRHEWMPMLLNPSSEQMGTSWERAHKESNAGVCSVSNRKNCDKRQFFTVKSPNNKGRNTVNNTLKRNFPTLMFHHKNRC